MLGRIIAAAFAVACLSIVVLLGWLASEEAVYITPFGLAAALLAPAGYGLLGLAFRSRDTEVLKKLAKVPDIQKLAAEAHSQEEKIIALEQERRVLETTVQFEAKRLSLRERREIIKTDAAELVRSWDRNKRDLEFLENAIDESPDADAIQKLRERIGGRSSDVLVLRFGSQTIRIDLGAIAEMAGGGFVVAYVELAESLVSIVRGLRRSIGRR